MYRPKVPRRSQGRRNCKMMVLVTTVVALWVLNYNMYRSLPTASQSQPTPQPTRSSFLQVHPDDFNYMNRKSNTSPIVVEKYKFLFFTIQKTGCTVMKQLARRMMGYKNWRTGKTWPTDKTGLKYLFDYDVETATKLMNDPSYTRATFVRDPKERYLSAFLDKGVQTNYFSEWCCQKKPRKMRPFCSEQASNFTYFVEETQTCYDSHWEPQTDFITDAYSKQLNFVGHLETAERDAKALLQRIGAWEEHGQSGWGKHRNESIFQSTSNVKHKTTKSTGDSKSRLSQYFTPELEKLVEERYAHDYERSEFSLPLKKIEYPARTAS